MLHTELGPEGITGVIDLFGGEAATPSAPVLARSRWGRSKRAAAAAAVLLAVGAGLCGFLVFSSQRSPSGKTAPPQFGPAEPALARVVEFDGSLDLMSPRDGAAPAIAGQDVRPGQALRTGQDSFAVLTHDAVRVELASDTTVRLLDEDRPGRGGRVYLSQGVVRIAAGPASEGRTAVISTPHASIVASSATFTWSATTDAT
jgi:hypothetical protein